MRSFFPWLLLIGGLTGCGSVLETPSSASGDVDAAGATRPDTGVDASPVAIDAGSTTTTDTDAASPCPGTAPMIDCPFCGVTGVTTAVCNGGWVCPSPPLGCPFVAFTCGAPDAGLRCNQINEYCVVAPDAGGTCLPYPSLCTLGGCACLDAGACTDDGGITVVQQ